MARDARGRVKLTRAAIEGPRCRPAPDGRQHIVWDSEMPGFGLRVGKSARAFIYQRDLPGGRTRRVTIGRWPAWSVDNARKRARELAVQIDRGVDPAAEKRARAARGVTLAQAVELHIARLEAKGGSQRTVDSMRDETRRHLGDFRPRPLREITRSDARRRHERLSKRNGPYVANRLMRCMRAASNTARREHPELPEAPTIAVLWNRERRRQEPIPWDDLPAWHERVLALSPVRRDYNLLVLLTGLRATDAATIRWDDVDLDRATLHRPRPKGGEARAFDVPLSRQCVEILTRRKAENETQFAPHKGDAGLVFPSVVRRDGLVQVVPLVEPKEQKFVREPGGKLRKIRWGAEPASLERHLHDGVPGGGARPVHDRRAHQPPAAARQRDGGLHPPERGPPARGAAARQRLPRGAAAQAAGAGRVAAARAPTWGRVGSRSASTAERPRAAWTSPGCSLGGWRRRSPAAVPRSMTLSRGRLGRRQHPTRVPRWRARRRASDTQLARDSVTCSRV